MKKNNTKSPAVVKTVGGLLGEQSGEELEKQPGEKSEEQPEEQSGDKPGEHSEEQPGDKLEEQLNEKANNLEVINPEVIVESFTHGDKTYTLRENVKQLQFNGKVYSRADILTNEEIMDKLITSNSPFIKKI